MYKEWAENEWLKCQKKITKTAERIKGGLPYSTENGKYQLVGDDIHRWTNSFWTGMLWLTYEETHDERFKKWAEESGNTLNKNFENISRLNHDVGFMWLLSRLRIMS